MSNSFWGNGYKRNFGKCKNVNGGNGGKGKKKKTKEVYNNCVKGIKDPMIFSNHTGENCISSKILFPNEENFIQAAFIDPGRVSCGIRIVKYYTESNYIEVLWFGIHNFGTDITDIIVGMENEIDLIKEKLQMCHHIIIESQLMKSQVNYRTFQHMISYIESITRNKGMKAVIFEVDIALKTVFIGGPRFSSQVGGDAIKKWTRMKANKILFERKDYISLSMIKNSLKKQAEDFSDTVCYEYAWWFYVHNLDRLNFKKF